MRFKKDTDISVVELGGRLIMSNSDDVKNELKSLLKKNDCLKPNEIVVIDLRQMEFLDSTGVGVLISIFKYLTEHQATLKIANPQGLVQKVIEITKINSIMEVIDL